MLQKIGRLFVIKTRFEAWLVIYAIALGAVERGLHYRVLYPGWMGWTLAVACTGVVFLAGAKLLDSVRPAVPAVAAGAYSPASRRHSVTRRNRPRHRPAYRVSERRTSRRID
jgi:hypothetical protein